MFVVLNYCIQLLAFNGTSLTSSQLDFHVRRHPMNLIEFVGACHVLKQNFFEGLYNAVHYVLVRLQCNALVLSRAHSEVYYYQPEL